MQLGHVVQILDLLNDVILEKEAFEVHEAVQVFYFGKPVLVKENLGVFFRRVVEIVSPETESIKELLGNHVLAILVLVRGRLALLFLVFPLYFHVSVLVFRLDDLKLNQNRNEIIYSVDR